MVDVEWKRIADDLRTTTGHELALSLEHQPAVDCWPEGSSWWVIQVSFDGSTNLEIGRGFPKDPEEFLAFLADQLRKDLLDEEIWGGWPICPTHKTHPLDAGTAQNGRASWWCPVKGLVAEIGTLGEL